MSEINGRVRRMAEAEQAAALKRQRAAADLRRREESQARNHEEVERLCNEFYGWAMGPAKGRVKPEWFSRIRGWRLYYQGGGPGSEGSTAGTAGIQLILTTSPTIFLLVEKGEALFFGKKTLYDKRRAPRSPALGVIRIDEMKDTIANYVLQAGIPWPYAD